MAVVETCEILSASRDELVIYFSPPTAGGSLAAALAERG